MCRGKAKSKKGGGEDEGEDDDFDFGQAKKGRAKKGKKGGRMDWEDDDDDELEAKAASKAEPEPEPEAAAEEEEAEEAEAEEAEEKGPPEGAVGSKSAKSATMSAAAMAAALGMEEDDDDDDDEAAAPVAAEVSGAELGAMVSWLHSVGLPKEDSVGYASLLAKAGHAPLSALRAASLPSSALVQQGLKRGHAAVLAAVLAAGGDGAGGDAKTAETALVCRWLIALVVGEDAAKTYAPNLVAAYGSLAKLVESASSPSSLAALGLRLGHAALLLAALPNAVADEVGVEVEEVEVPAFDFGPTRLRMAGPGL